MNSQNFTNNLALPFSNKRKISKRIKELINILHDKALNNRTKQNQKDSSPKEIIVDNKIVKHLSNVIKNNLNNLKVKNDEYNKALVNYENEFKKKSNSGKSEKKP